jgi:hypothetical protein
VQAEDELAEYFAGKRTTFGIKLDMIGTEFQKKVWAALLTIPFRETRSYADIARQVGHPNAFRAVGAANGRNPVSIVTPLSSRDRGGWVVDRLCGRSRYQVVSAGVGRPTRAGCGLNWRPGRQNGTLSSHTGAISMVNQSMGHKSWARQHTSI